MKMKSPRKKKIIIYVIITIAIILSGIGINAVVGAYQMSMIPSMCFKKMMAYTTKNNKDAIITVGIIKNGEMGYTVYGENGVELPQIKHTYEIGSITKTFTCSLLCKAIEEGKVSLTDPIDKYIALPEGNYYPTFDKLVTHTSGYKEYYFNWQMASNFLCGQGNHFYGISTETLNTQIANHILEKRSYAFNYSNFGISVVGSALESVYGNDYKTIMNDFISSDLKLEQTRISDGTGDLHGYWPWKSDDGYIPAGAIVSNISDMMKYVELHMTEKLPYISRGHHELAEINATSEQYEKMNIRMDSAGVGWMIDTQSGIIWHNGGTSNYNSYIAFDKKNDIGVIILSNLPPNYRIPATVMGAKLMADLSSDYE